jgi:hypothetical protein
MHAWPIGRRCLVECVMLVFGIHNPWQEQWVLGFSRDVKWYRVVGQVVTTRIVVVNFT